MSSSPNKNYPHGYAGQRSRMNGHTPRKKHTNEENRGIPNWMCYKSASVDLSGSET